MSHPEKVESAWCVYVLENIRDGKHYIGISQNVTSRLKRHNSGLVRFTKGHRPFRLVGYKPMGSLSEARATEVRLKAFKDPARACNWIENSF